MRANSVPGGTIREGALFFQTVAAAGALFKRGHYSREYGMPILCRNQPPLNTPMPDKTTVMRSTARVHVVSVVPVGTCLGTRAILELAL